MPLEYYSTPEAVKLRTGIQASDLGLEADSGTNTPLDDFLRGLLVEITDLMNRTMRRDYIAEVNAGTLEQVPAGLHGIAADICADSVRTMVVSRQTPVVRIDDFAIRTVTSATLNADVLKRLKLYSKGQGASSYDVTQSTLAGLPTAITAMSLDTMDL